jgi:hypothetical protein
VDCSYDGGFVTNFWLTKIGRPLVQLLKESTLLSENSVAVDIEGVESDNNVKLSTATIHSRNRTYGSRDQGEQGILNVFCFFFCTEIVQ